MAVVKHLMLTPLDARARRPRHPPPLGTVMRRLMTAVALLAATPAAAATSRLDGLEVGQPWSRPAAAGMNGAGYLTLTNRGKALETLTGVETPAAARVEVHSSSMSSGVMSMRPQPATPIPPGRTVTFAPGGLHLMLIGLKEPLKAGETFPATLVFASGARMKVTFKVAIAAPAAGPAHDHARAGH
jgi:periplasmic copper chaperone A